MREITAEQLSEILERHAKWLNGEDDGKRADLSNANLGYANLRYADLGYANLRNANLGYANLRYANLSNANLRYANLSNANLRNADLRNANLRYANLSNANLRNADLGYANLRNADLRNADLDMSCWPLRCGGTMAKLSRRTSLQLIYHAFNQHHGDGDIVKALETLRPLADEFRRKYREDAPALRGCNES